MAKSNKPKASDSKTPPKATTPAPKPNTPAKTPRPGGKPAASPATKAKPASAPAPAPKPAPVITDAQISQRAYEIWLSEGRPEGRSHQHWAMAHAQLLAEQTSRETAP